MRTLIIVAILLYGVTANPYYDYEDAESKHSAALQRRNWRRGALMHQLHGARAGQQPWQSGTEDLHHPRYPPEEPAKDGSNFDSMSPPKSSEANFYEKENEDKPETKVNVEKEKDKIPMNCEREHERYEPCFAGCAAVSCDNPRARPRPCYPYCEPGCVCAPPRVRDDRTHKCVTVDNCTKGLKGIPDLGEEQ